MVQIGQAVEGMVLEGATDQNRAVGAGAVWALAAGHIAELMPPITTVKCSIPGAA